MALRRTGLPSGEGEGGHESDRGRLRQTLQGSEHVCLWLGSAVGGQVDGSGLRDLAVSGCVSGARTSGVSAGNTKGNANGNLVCKAKRAFSKTPGKF